MNGQIVPIIHMQPGEVQRWRLIDATFRETLKVRLEDHDLHEIALDGLYTGTVDTWDPGQSVNLESGYRSDVVVKASSKAGTYELFDSPASEDESVRNTAEDKVVLALVKVDGDPIDMALPTEEEMKPLGFRSGEDLRAKTTGVQQVEFMVGSDEQASAQHYFHVNGHAFNESQTRFLELNKTEAWRITTVGDPEGVPASNPDFAIPPVEHIFHIHINPFQVEQDRPSGTRLVWRDTVIVRGAESGDDPVPVWVYTDYKDFTGKFVMHCHVLDHEDLGMMELMEVVDKLPMTHEGH